MQQHSFRRFSVSKAELFDGLKKQLNRKAASKEPLFSFRISLKSPTNLPEKVVKFDFHFHNIALTGKKAV
jgi:hypothetical protein